MYYYYWNLDYLKNIHHNHKWNKSEHIVIRRITLQTLFNFLLQHKCHGIPRKVNKSRRILRLLFHLILTYLLHCTNY